MGQNILYRAIIVMICILTFSFEIRSQNKVSGNVIDATNGESIIGASIVRKEDPTKGTVTDYDGSFDISLPSLPSVIIVSYIGYKDVEYTVSTLGKVEIKMGEEPVTIDLGVEIKGQRISDKQKAAPLTIESLDAIAIKQTASTDFYNGLGSLKGVDLTTASLGFTVINMRGFNSTSPVRSLQTIDGVDNQSPGLNFSLGNFLGASELDVLKVDLVVGASSAFYGPNAFNGVIAMETKNPFFHQGLAASVKVGERSMLDVGFRYGDAFKNKSGKPFFAYKVNFSYLRANDWVADNYDPVTNAQANRVWTAALNPGGSNAVNVYGDEYFDSSAELGGSRAGLNYFHRKGYKEEDIVDYDTRNLKAGAAIYIRTRPSQDYDSPEIILASRYGSGTTVYQGENRFSLRGIQFYQHQLELRKKDKYFIRAYVTHEDAGDSYDPYFTAQKMQETAATNENWGNAYAAWWTNNDLGGVFKKMRDLGYPADGFAAQEQWQRDSSHFLREWHAQANSYANKGNSLYNSKDFYEVGTARYDSLFNSLVSRKNNSKEGGTKFFDKSALFHLHGEYKIPVNGIKELVIGANGRMYRPFTDGTIFVDSVRRITNTEFGFYSGVSKEFGDFTVSAAARLDKNQNFNFLFSPAASVVYKPSQNNYLRLSFSSAIRNPTLADQYLNLKVGPAQLQGNLDGYKGLVTFESFNKWRNNTSSPFVKRNIAPIRPEQVRTVELGYRTTLGERLFLDISGYYSRYTDFIGYQVGIDIPSIVSEQFFPGSGIFDTLPLLGKAKVLRISANSDETVVSRGASAGFNYYFSKYYAFNGNYSFNELAKQVADSVLVPAFNTPRNKFNVGISGRDLPVFNKKGLIGFNINYKWIEGFTFEGSPQFTGLIPSYDLVDAQVNYTIPKNHVVIKLGASNILNNKQFQTYGGPRIGRMAYLSLTYDFKQKI